MHIDVLCHYIQASVDGCIFNLGDCAHIKVLHNSTLLLTYSVSR